MINDTTQSVSQGWSNALRLRNTVVILMGAQQPTQVVILFLFDINHNPLYN